MWAAELAKRDMIAICMFNGGTECCVPHGARKGVNIIAPPMYMLLALDGDEIVPSVYANANAKAAGLDIITWTLERSGFLIDGGWVLLPVRGQM